MATHTTLASLFSDIAAAIRAKTGNTGTIVADNFPTAIANIPTGAEVIEATMTTNGTYSYKFNAVTAMDSSNITTSGVTLEKGDVIVVDGYPGVALIACPNTTTSNYLYVRGFSAVNNTANYSIPSGTYNVKVYKRVYWQS